MTDLEMLELLEKAKEKNTGPKGEPGVGIQSVEQFEDNSFTFRLTDGSFKKIQLPTPQDGAVGPAGVQGERGLPGPAGKSGRDGAPGSPGVDGLRGSDGSFVETALVNARGRLLIGLSDGEVIDAGAVVGPVGATGERGATGLPGQPGADGAAVLSGPRTPTQDDGVEGDHWIDISSAEFSFFKKSGNGWSKLANLRQPARDTRVGASAGGGGGSGGSGGGGPAGGYNTSNLPMTGLGREAKDGEDDVVGNPPLGGISKPGGNIIPEAISLRYQSNFNRWAVESLDSLDDNLPVHSVDELPDEGAYDGDMVLCNDALWIYHAPNWIEVGGAVDPADFPRVDVRPTPPAHDPTNLGDLWYCTLPDDLTLYVYDGAVWVPASPPVSLDGITEDIAGVQDYIDTNITPALAGAVGDVRALETKTDGHGDRLDTLEEAQGQDERDITALRSRVTGTEAKNDEQDGRLDVLEASEGGPGDGNYAEKDKINVFTRQNTFEARTVMNNHLTLQSDNDSQRLYMKNSTGATNLTIFPNGSISSKAHINFTPSGKDTFAERYSSYFRVDTPDDWVTEDGDFGLYVDISRGNSQQNRFTIGGRAGREKAFSVWDDGAGKAKVYGDFIADNKITSDTLEVKDEAAFKDAQFTGVCDVSGASHTNNCALPKTYFKTVLKEYNGQFRSIYINHGSDGTGNGVPIQIKAAPTAGNLIELRDKDNATRFGINVGAELMYGGTTSAPWMATRENQFTTKKYVDDAIESTTGSDRFAGPSGMKFQFGGTDLNTIAPGQFVLAFNRVYISTTNADGIEWAGGLTYKTDKASIWSHLTIYEILSNGGFNIDRMYQVEEFYIGEPKGTTRMLELTTVYQKFGSGLPSIGGNYILSLGGFF